MSKTEWKEYKLGDFAVFNPTEHLSKGSIAKKIAMDKLIPYCRNISNFELEAFSGGTKFRNGDTIMARITPCLENGKISQVRILDEDEIGFGSTEYIVFRAKEGVSDPDFLYYLVTSDIVKEPAIKSMVGSSGRQRVQTDVVQNLKIKVPPLAEQQRIAKILSSLDDKIELNNAINRNLEEHAQAIFRSWFVDFEPFGGKIPKDWNNGKLGDIAEIKKKAFHPEKNPGLVVEHYSLPALDEKHYPVFEITDGIKSNKFIVSKESVLISKLNPDTKRIWRPYCISEYPICSTEFVVFEAINGSHRDYIYSIIDCAQFYDYMCSLITGCTNSHQRVSPETLLEFPVSIPPKTVLKSFCDKITPIYEMIEKNVLENQHLTSLRDVLLPKLMSEAFL